ncbi:MAG: BatA domain-containing protein [Cyclobacteriaceae bacterium]
MSFLYPSFLWGLLALAIPIIVHLFNFRKAKKIYFSNVSFLENVKESSSSKMKLKYWLVLASRLLLVFFLVLAFAQPFLPGNEKGMDSTLVKIYLDNSQSSSNLTESEISGLDLGVGYMDEIIKLYPKQTQYQIITNDFASTSVNPKSKNKATELVAETDYSYLTRSQPEIFSKIDPLTNSASKEDIYIISDFQESTFPSNKQIAQDSSNLYKVIPLTYASQDNIFIDTVFLENPFLMANELNKLHVKAKNLGDQDVSDVVFKLFVNDALSASASLGIPKNSTSELIIDLNFKLNDINSCLISFEDFPLTFDNEYFFTLNQLKKINVSEIHNNQNRGFVDNVFADNELFNYRSFENGQIDYAQVVSSDMLIINQLSEIEQSLLNIADDFLKSGKSVFIIPGTSPDTLALSTLFGRQIKTEKKSEKVALENPDIKNPFFENIFTDLNISTEMPQGSSLISWPKTGTNLLTIKNGLPFLTSTSQDGTLYLLSSPLTDEYTNFHKHALFVPVLYRMAALSSTNYFPLSYSIEEAVITLKVDSINTEKLYTLSRGEEEYIPQQRVAGDQLILELPKFLLSPGFYDLKLDDELKNTLAFNYSKAESNPAQMSSEEIAQSFDQIKNLEIIESTDAQSFAENMKERYEGVQLWKYALVLSLIFLFVETLFLRFL